MVLHWAAGAGGKGALLSGDIVQVVQDNKSVSFMWSFPNFIPLSAPRACKAWSTASSRTRSTACTARSWTARSGATARASVERSAERYLKIIGGDGTYELQ